MAESTATPPAAVTPPPPPAAKPTPGPDPWMATILSDMGKAVSDGQVIDAPAKAPDQPHNVLDGEFISMGEHARFKKEEKERKDAAAKEEKPAEEKPGEKKEETPKKEEVKAGEEKKEETPAAATPPPAKPKIVVEKAKPIEEIVEGVVRRVAQEKPAEVPKPEVKKEETPAADPDAEFVEALDEDQKEVVELARYAAKAMPDKYGTMAKKTVDYMKKVEAYIDGKRKEDSDWDPDTDEGFAAFIEENRPTYQAGDRKKLERQLIADQVRQDVEKEFRPKIEATERAERVREIKPEIDKAAESYVGAVAQRFAPDEKSPFAGVMKVVTEKGMTDEAWKEAKAIDPLAAATAQNYMAQANTLGREYLELVGGVAQQTAYDPAKPATSAGNQKALLQQRLFGFIDQQEQIFARDGGDMRTVNGKTFVTRREFAAMPAAEQAKHWVLGHEDVLDMLAVAASNQAQQALAAEVKRREDEGYVRNGKHAGTKKEQAATAAPTKKEESPKTTLTPSPGAANLPPPVSGQTAFTEEELKRQWAGGANSWV